MTLLTFRDPKTQDGSELTLGGTNPRRVAHCRVSSLVMVCRRSLANLLATETALLTRRQQSADHKDKVCQVGVTVNTE